MSDTSLTPDKIVEALLDSSFSRVTLGTDKLASVTKSASDYPSTAKVSSSFGICPASICYSSS